jgi:hypothetical protein
MGQRPPPPKDPGLEGSYGQHDQSPAARRNQWRTDQHYGVPMAAGERGADPFGEGGLAAGGTGQSGYGGEYGQLEPSQRHEKAVPEDRKRGGTGFKQDR